MAYTINKTDGAILTTVIDGTSDSTTDLDLIGKNYTSYGEKFNENFVKLLENFSNVTPPSRPITGQLWYDSAGARLMVYDTSGWKVAGGPIVTSTSPLSFSTGDLWIDNQENQLWFFDGSDLLLAGPIWKKSQGKTGFVAETLYDSNKNPKSVLFMYIADSLLGVYSAQAFTPVPALPGFTTLEKGFTSSSLVNATYNFSASNALALNGFSSSQFMRSDIETFNSTRIVIQNNQGLSIGSPELADFKVSGNVLIIENISNGGDIVFKTNNSSGSQNAIYVDSTTNRVGIFTSSPQQMLDVAGNVRIRGDLIVEGENLTVSVSSLTVEDKNIEIAVVSSPTDVTADGAGITIKGTTDKTILYNNTLGSKSFDISENINLAADKVIRIGGVNVLSGSELAPAITTVPRCTSVGPLVNLTVADVFVENNKISSRQTNQDIQLEPNGLGNVSLVGSPRITGLANPTDPQDACTKAYAEVFARLSPISLTLTKNGLGGTINTSCISLLNDVANPLFYTPGKFAFIHIEELDNSVTPLTVTRSLKRFLIKNTGSGNFWDFDSDLTSSI